MGSLPMELLQCTFLYISVTTCSQQLKAAVTQAEYCSYPLSIWTTYYILLHTTWQIHSYTQKVMTDWILRRHLEGFSIFNVKTQPWYSLTFTGLTVFCQASKQSKSQVLSTELIKCPICESAHSWKIWGRPNDEHLILSLDSGQVLHEHQCQRVYIPSKWWELQQSTHFSLLARKT